MVTRRRSPKKAIPPEDQWEEPQELSFSDKYQNTHAYPNYEDEKVVQALLNNSLVFSGSKKAWEACKRHLEYDNHSEVENPLYTQTLEAYKAEEKRLEELWEKEGVKDMFEDYGVTASPKVMQAVNSLARDRANGYGFRETISYMHDLIPLVELVMKEHCQNTPPIQPTEKTP